MYTAFADTVAEYNAWWRTLQVSHRRRIRLVVMTLDHELLSEMVVSRFYSGQVTFDAARTPTRVGEVTIFDPRHTIRVEPDSPDAAPVYRNRLVRVWDEILVPAGAHGDAQWLGPPVITGQIEDFDRTGATVRLILNGKEMLAGEAGEGRAFKKKWNKAAVIRTLLADAGEEFLRIPDRRSRLPKRLVLTRTDSRWEKARRLARSMDDVLTYNGPGAAVMFRRSDRPALTIGPRLLTSEVTLDRGSDTGSSDGSDRRNRWEVTGGVPKGTRRKPRAVVDLPKPHKMSAYNQGRGTPRKLRRLGEYVEDPHVKTRAAALRLAQRMRDRDLRQVSNYSADTLPIPNLEEGDVARLFTDDGYVLAPLTQWTLDLVGGMTIGALRRARTSGPTRGASRAWWQQLPAPKGGKGGGRGGRGRGGRGGRRS